MPDDLQKFIGQLEGVGAVVLDGFSSWLEGRLAFQPESADPGLLDVVNELSNLLSRSSIPSVVVSTEMGLGVPPHGSAEMRLLKIAASANQILASNATSMVLLVSGVPLKVR